MGLKRFVSSMLRTGPLRASKPGELASGCPSVFTEDGMWTALVRRQQQVTPPNGLMKPHGYGFERKAGHNAAESAPSHQLPRKRCWLMKRSVQESREKC